MGVDADVDITTEDCKTLLALLQRHLPGTTAWVYGSRVKWTSRPQSDLDLVVFVTPEQRGQVGDLREAFEESNLPFRVDLFVWDDVPDSFRRGIEAEHVALAREPRHYNADWREALLGDVTEFISGGTPSKAQSRYWNGSIPWVSAKDMKRFRLRDTTAHVTPEGLANGTRQVPVGSVLLLTRGMTLLNDVPVCVTERPMGFNQDVKALRPKLGIAPAFLPYLVLGNKDRLLNLVDLAGHGTGRLNTEELKTFDILLPPSAEQHAIAHILGTLDDKIELNRRLNATLEEMARALFRSWFVDFDPVRAKREGRDTGLPIDIADLFPDRLVDSELGEVPEGWAQESLSEHFEVAKGVSYKGSGLGDNGVPLHNLNSVDKRGGYRCEGIKFYSGDYADRHVVRSGDVIVANTDLGRERLLIGYAAIVPRLFGNSGILSHHLYRVRTRPSGRLSTAFLYGLLNSPQMHDVVAGYANGTTVTMLPRDALQTPAVVVPPTPLLESFGALVLHLEHRREQTVRESQSLAALRDALLPKLVSGELRMTAPEAVCARDKRPASVEAHEA